jgi:hypothetical protein
MPVINLLLRYIGRLGLCLLLVATGNCSSNDSPTAKQVLFCDHTKKGKLSLIILGDYFHPSFNTELVAITKRLTLTGTPTFICSKNLSPEFPLLLESNGVRNSRFIKFEPNAPILKKWARDVVLTGVKNRRLTAIVSPRKNASTREQAHEMVKIMQQVLPNSALVEAAPFVFDGGNLAFFEDKQGKRVLITGKKTIFDNEAYQQRPWAEGLKGELLLKSLKTTFQVDSVIVVGLARKRPPSSMYFEYHIDMGMTILSGRRAVVSQLSFEQDDIAEFAHAINSRHNAISPFLAHGDSAEVLLATLSKRLMDVKNEYESYATILGKLGIEIYRSPKTWLQVVSYMSWTNVLQAGNTLLMPLYPDSIYGKTTRVNMRNGQMLLQFDTSSLYKEKFELEGYNKINFELYESLGYEVVPVPEYFHYFMGGIHCFVNILQ